MDNKVVGITIAVMVSVALIGGLLVPIVNNAIATSDTYINEGYFFMDKYDSTTNLSITWNYDNPDEFIVNGAVVKYENANLFVSVIISKEFAVRVTADGLSLAYYGSGSSFSANESNPNFSLTYEGGVCTASNGTTEKSTNTAWLFCISNDGDYVMKKSNESVYLNENSEILANGITYFGSAGAQTVIYGDWMDPTHEAASTITDFTVNYEKIDSHVDLYTLSSYTFDMTREDVTQAVTYSYFVVPYEVTADRVVPMDPVAAGVLTVAPIIVITSILAMVAAVLIRSKF